MVPQLSYNRLITIASEFTLSQLKRYTKLDRCSVELTISWHIARASTSWVKQKIYPNTAYWFTTVNSPRENTRNFSSSELIIFPVIIISCDLLYSPHKKVMNGCLYRQWWKFHKECNLPEGAMSMRISNKFLSVILDTHGEPIRGHCLQPVTCRIVYQRFCQPAVFQH